ncbi:hypothetical protein F5Y10DRAFT_228424 [Nemania abortiva]|nr:hypothetical protein F5Y10DRAFT_228424 [Nemania abortiva]
MSSHYPLNGIDLDFRRYAHRPFEGRDVLISHIVEDLFNPRRLSPRTYLKIVGRPRGFGYAKAQDRELGLDMQVMWRLLEMEWPAEFIHLQQAIIQLVQAHYFERDPLIHQAMKCFSYRNDDPKTASNWKQDMIAHLALFRRASLVRHRFSLFSGNSQLSSNEGPWNRKLSLGSCFVAVPWTERGPKWQKHLERAARRSEYWTIPGSSVLHHRVPARSQSLPAKGSWGIVTSSPKYGRRREENIPYVAFFPLKPLSELDKHSRRRSLSRSHIRAMFKDKAEWIIEESVPDDPWLRPKHPCSNCAQLTHKAKDCLSCCGYCNSTDHSARNCTLKSENRCKCQPFPQFHRSSQCHVPCSRRCGSPHPPGTYKHMSAMLCSYRCCMCGMKGHSGKKCSLKRCPCGGQHLTQDCRWKVECIVKGCYYYLCPLHCKECGKKKEKGQESAFVGRTCQACLKNGVPVSERAPDPPTHIT